jgi:hypothetical protein
VGATRLFSGVRDAEGQFDIPDDAGEWRLSRDTIEVTGLRWSQGDTCALHCVEVSCVEANLRRSAWV